MKSLKVQHVNITAISVIFFLLAAVTMFLSGMQIRKANQCMQEEARIHRERRECEKQGRVLAAEAYGMDFSGLPDQVASVELDPGEQELSAKEQHRLVMDYMFGPDYKEGKNRILGDIARFQELLFTRKQAELDEASQGTYAALHITQCLNLVMLLILLLLSRIGKHYGLDRISIIQVDAGHLSCHVRYQWAKIPSDSQLGKSFNISRPKLDALMDSYDKDGLCDKDEAGGRITLAASFTPLSGTAGCMEG